MYSISWSLGSFHCMKHQFLICNHSMNSKTQWILDWQSSEKWNGVILADVWHHSHRLSNLAVGCRLLQWAVVHGNTDKLRLMLKDTVWRNSAFSVLAGFCTRSQFTLWGGIRAAAAWDSWHTPTRRITRSSHFRRCLENCWRSRRTARLARRDVH